MDRGPATHWFSRLTRGRQRMHRSEFVWQLKVAVPEAVSALKGYRDSLTMEMSAFAMLAQEAIRSGDLDLVRRCFSFAHEVWSRGNRDVRNALVVGFLEDLDLSGPNGARAEKLLSTALREERRAVLAYLEEVSGRSLS